MRKYYKTRTDNFREAHGKEMEKTFIQCAYNAEIPHLQNTLNTMADKEDGCDFIYEGYPCDVTLQFQKDHEEITKTKYEFVFGGIEVKVEYGIRIGNNHHQFVEPVCVIHLNLDMYFVHKLDNIFESELTKAMPELLSKIIPVYERYLETQ